MSLASHHFDPRRAAGRVLRRHIGLTFTAQRGDRVDFALSDIIAVLEPAHPSSARRSADRSAGR